MFCLQVRQMERYAEEVKQELFQKRGEWGNQGQPGRCHGRRAVEAGKWVGFSFCSCLRYAQSNTQVPQVPKP